MQDASNQMKIAAISLLLALAWPSLAAAPPRVAYAAPKGSCDGYPRLDIGMAPGFCAGLVSGPTQGGEARRMILPRSLLQLDERTWLVSDLGHWDASDGGVWKLTVGSGKPAVVTRLLGGLKVPHALAMGPDKRVYVGEMSRILRFDPRAADPAKTIETVVAGLPDNRLHSNRHPLSKFVFAPDGALLVNVGAPSDQCLDAKGKPLGKSCPQSEAGERAASIRRYSLQAPARWSRHFTVFARGLRNSVALAVHPSGTILQGENSYDFADRWSPFEEINRIEAGRHYGWPYCADMAAPTPGWASARVLDCASPAHTPPVALMPPHAAPLDMLWYGGAMFPALKGRLLMSWHGHRATGGRIVAFTTDEKGLPLTKKAATYAAYGSAAKPYPNATAAQPDVLTPGWDKVAGKRPLGSPVGLAVARDGAIWTTDDRAGLVIRIAIDRP